MRSGAVIADGPPRALMGHDTDPYVRELMQTPRRQAERLHALMAEPDAAEPDAAGPDAAGPDAAGPGPRGPGATEPGT
jgi:hypothetical protein